MKIFRSIRYIYLQIKGYLVFGRWVGIHGDFTVVNPANVTIGDQCGVNHGVFILGHNQIEIGNGVVLSARVMLIDSGLQLDGFAYEECPPHIAGYVKIRDGAWIGAGAIVLAGVTIGRKSVVGAGSVVTRDVDDYAVVAGIPARQIGRTDSKVISEDTAN